MGRHESWDNYKMITNPQSIAYLPHSVRTIEIWQDQGDLVVTPTQGIRVFDGDVITSAKRIRFFEGGVSLTLQEESIKYFQPTKDAYLWMCVDFWNDDGEWNDYHVDGLKVNSPRRIGSDEIIFSARQEDLQELNFVEPTGSYEIKDFTPPKDYCKLQG